MKTVQQKPISISKYFVIKSQKSNNKTRKRNKNVLHANDLILFDIFYVLI